MRFRDLKNIPRIKEITTILIRNGMQTFAAQLGLPILEKIKSFIRPQGSDDVDPVSLPRQIRQALQELGPTFIKLGQILSTRHDLLGPNYIEEFAKLQDDVPPMTLARVDAILLDELGKRRSELFENFDETPLGAASIGQVHRAVTREGQEVVVKIQRAGIRETIRSDIDILYSLAELVKERELIGELYDPVEIVDEFSRSIRQELDYVREAQNVLTFRRNFEGVEGVFIPNVYHEYSTDRVLCMDFIRGTKAGRLDPAVYDLKEVVRNGVRAVLQQVFIDGCFHADPHPGNILVLPGNVVSFVDFGMIGRLSNKMRDQIASLLLGLVTHDYDQIAREIVFTGKTREDVDLDELSLAIMDTIDPYTGLPLKKINVGALLQDILTQIARYRIKFPSNYSLMIKSLMTIENLGKRLDPEFDMLAEARPFVERLVLDRWKPKRLKKDVWLTAKDALSLLQRLPIKADSILGQLQQGALTVGFQHKGLQGAMNSLDHVGNRLSLSFVIGALVIGSSAALSAQVQPTILNLPLVTVLFVLAGLLGVGLAVSIIRSGHY